LACVRPQCRQRVDDRPAPVPGQARAHRRVPRPRRCVDQATEAFQDGAAGAHVNSEHFATFVGWAPDVVPAVPQIISTQDVPGSGWGDMGEIKPR
jgi:hypothetical protein